MGTLSYIKNYLKDRDVASVTPSSRFLVRRICRRMDFNEPRIIVEYGPGEGVFSNHIWKRMSPDSRLILIETNPDFTRKLQALTTSERVEVVQDTAENVKDILANRDIAGADYVLSGIPFSFFDEQDREVLIRTTRDVLKPGGQFLVYQHHDHMDEPLRRIFAQVEAEREWLNVPPIHVHAATKST
jgi:phospholipid N-methyltransferase